MWLSEHFPSYEDLWDMGDTEVSCTAKLWSVCTHICIKEKNRITSETAFWQRDEYMYCSREKKENDILIKISTENPEYKCFYWGGEKMDLKRKN